VVTCAVRNEGHYFCESSLDPVTKIRLILMLVSIFVNGRAVYAQPYALDWSRQFGTHRTDSGTDVVTDESGNVFVSGYTYGSLGGTNIGRSDAFLRKYNSSGAELWTQQMGTSNWDIGTSVAINQNGDAYITGYTSGSFGAPSVGATDAFIAKLDPSGRILWTTQTGTRNDDESNAIAVDRFDNVYITGYIEGAMNGSSVGGRDQFLAKFSSSGMLLWTKQLGTNGFDQGNSIATDSSGNVYTSGSSNSRATLRKFDGQGNTLWTKHLGMNSVRSDAVAVDKFDNVYVTGPTWVIGDDGAGSNDSYLIKLDSSGGELWTKLYGEAAALNISTSLALDRFGDSVPILL